MFCPRCQLFCATKSGRCPECDFDFSAKRPADAAPCDDWDRVTLFEGDMQLLETASAALDEAGIDFWILKRRTSPKDVHMPPGKVEVRTEDEDAAREALAEHASWNECQHAPQRPFQCS